MLPPKLPSCRAQYSVVIQILSLAAVSVGSGLSLYRDRDSLFPGEINYGNQGAFLQHSGCYHGATRSGVFKVSLFSGVRLVFSSAIDRLEGTFPCGYRLNVLCLWARVAREARPDRAWQDFGGALMATALVLYRRVHSTFTVIDIIRTFGHVQTCSGTDRSCRRDCA